MKQLLLSAVCAMAAFSLLTPSAQAQNPGTSTTGSGTSGTGTNDAGAGLGAGNRRHGGSASPERQAQEIIAKFDKDGDHALNASELAAFFTAMRERQAKRQAQQASSGTPSPTSSNAGQPGHGHPQEQAAKAIGKFDKNGDGKLDAGELAAMIIARREHMRNGQSPSQSPAPSQAPNHSAPATTILSPTGN